MRNKLAENLVLLAGATGLLVMGLRLARLLAFAAFSLGRSKWFVKLDRDTRDE
jgi:hypothetical protein